MASLCNSMISRQYNFKYSYVQIIYKESVCSFFYVKNLTQTHKKGNLHLRKEFFFECSSTKTSRPWHQDGLFRQERSRTKQKKLHRELLFLPYLKQLQSHVAARYLRKQMKSTAKGLNLMKTTSRTQQSAFYVIK